MSDRPIIAAATRWRSAVFAGICVEVTGWAPKPGTENTLEIAVEGMLLADLRANDDGTGASLLLVAECNDPEPDMPIVLAQLLYALENANG